MLLGMGATDESTEALSTGGAIGPHLTEIMALIGKARP
jgi:hypothetical protein